MQACKHGRKYSDRTGGSMNDRVSTRRVTHHFILPSSVSVSVTPALQLICPAWPPPRPSLRLELDLITAGSGSASYETVVSRSLSTAELRGDPVRTVGVGLCFPGTRQPSDVVGQPLLRLVYIVALPIQNHLFYPINHLQSLTYHHGRSRPHWCPRGAPRPGRTHGDDGHGQGKTHPSRPAVRVRREPRGIGSISGVV